MFPRDEVQLDLVGASSEFSSDPERGNSGAPWAGMPALLERVGNPDRTVGVVVSVRRGVRRSHHRPSWRLLTPLR
jgi:hypothetical protein